VNDPNQRPPMEDPLSLFPRALTKMYSTWATVTYPFASIGKRTVFHFTTKVSRQRSRRIALGNSIRIGEHVWLNVATDEPDGEPTIVIDDHSVVASGSILSAKNQIHLEHHVNVAQQVLIMDHNHAYEDIDMPILDQGITAGGRIRIGAESWIGRGSAILCARGELTIGRHCVVSANSVVTTSVPDYCVVFGNPATIIRHYDPEKRAWRMGPVKRTAASREGAAEVVR
jgi:acetyltransferase-like isoleucine patch superfamily enzyme